MIKLRKKIIWLALITLCVSVISKGIAESREGELDSIKYGNTYVTIGTDSDCDYLFPSQSLQDAIDNSGATEIRVVTGVNFAPISVINQKVVLKGGYSNCIDADNDMPSDSLSIISGTVGNIQSNIDLMNSDGSEIHRLLVQNGQKAGVRIRDSSDVIIKDTAILNNLSNFAGGGIFLGNASELWLENVNISNNSTDFNGGGIACYDISTLTIVGESVINNNHADESGGGIYGVNCTVQIVGGSVNAEINNNTSNTFGGGVHFLGNSDVLITGGVKNLNGTLYGDSRSPISISNNLALQSGGGIFVGNQGSNMSLSMQNIKVSENSALNGAGIYVNGSLVSLNITGVDEPCWSNISCNSIEHNMAENRGGALVVTGAAQAHVREVSFRGNRANEGTAAFIGGGDSELTLESSFISANGDNGQGDYNDLYLFYANNNASLNLKHITAVDNNLDSGVVAANNSTVTVQSSILYNPDAGSYVNSINSTVISECLLLDDTFNQATLDIQIMNSNDYQGLFLAPAIGDYHLSMNAGVAVDQCQLAAIANIDIDREPFGFDDPFSSNQGGGFLADAGADELYNRNVSPDDLIFRNGF